MQLILYKTIWTPPGYLLYLLIYFTCIDLLLKLQPNLIMSHPLNTYAKFSEKLTFLTHVHVRIRRLEILKRFVAIKIQILSL